MVLGYSSPRKNNMCLFQDFGMYFQLLPDNMLPPAVHETVHDLGSLPM